MTDFRTPPPMPQAPVFNPAPTPTAAQPQPQPQQQPTSAAPAGSADFDFSILKTTPMMIVLAVVCVVGMFLGSTLFGGSSSAPKQKSTGLTGVVRNQDITKNLPRCGLTDRGQACVLYIVNHTRYDKIAEEFFDEAVKLTEVQRYSIAIANPKYAKTRIPPGHFAQIHIPNVR